MGMLRITKSSVITFLFILTISFYCEGASIVMTKKHEKFVPCPNSPNCINSKSDNPTHTIDPLLYEGKEHPFSLLIPIIEKMSGTSIITQEENYLHVEFRSMLFSFVDDVEFSYEAENKLIHIRSASRSGYYDFGANRKRLERIRKHFNLRK
ncbi:MAG: hypothetical protein ACI9S8_000689 [Chlamydiales bacterium]|jgi:uncharacterized protein (DUF1499 family)